MPEDDLAGTDAIPEPEPEPEPEPSVGVVGDSFSVTGTEYDDDAIEVPIGAEIKLESAQQIEPGEFDSKPEYGRYIQAVVTVKGTDGKFTVNPFDFVVSAPDGSQFEGAFVSDEGRGVPALHDRTLRQGQKVEGSLFFDVPKGEGLRLVYQPSSESVAEWKLGLK